MKNKIAFVCTLLVSLFSFSQSLQKEIQHPDIAGRLFHNPPKENGKILGSPYSQPMFSSANVEKLNITAYMRYNVVNDEFEFITSKNDTLILDKIEDFSTVTIDKTKKYQLTQYTNRRNKLTYGYLINCYQKGAYALFKKENISLTEEKIAKTTLEVNMPAKYVKVNDTFYLKNKDLGISEFPDSKKGLVKLYPDKKEAIESFLKANKIDLEEQSDMIKIVDFLSGL